MRARCRALSSVFAGAAAAAGAAAPLSASFGAISPSSLSLRQPRHSSDGERCLQRNVKRRRESCQDAVHSEGAHTLWFSACVSLRASSPIAY